jgi:hypothetical protein
LGHQNRYRIRFTYFIFINHVLSGHNLGTSIIHWTYNQNQADMKW